MYKVLVESLPNVIHSFGKEDIRYNYVYFLELLGNIELYNKHKSLKTKEYKKVCNLLNYLNENLDQYRILNSILWNLEYLGINNFKEEKILTDVELEESAKILVTIVKMNYWYV